MNIKKWFIGLEILIIACFIAQIRCNESGEENEVCSCPLNEQKNRISSQSMIMSNFFSFPNFEKSGLYGYCQR